MYRFIPTTHYYKYIVPKHEITFLITLNIEHWTLNASIIIGAASIATDVWYSLGHTGIRQHAYIIFY